MHSLWYKVVDPGTLLTKFLPYYLVFAETKLDEGFPNLWFLIINMEYKKNDGS